MKNLLNLFVCLFFASFTSFSQSFIDQNFASEINDDSYTRVTVGSKAFSLLNSFTTNMKDEEAKKMGEIISKVKSFDLIASEKVGNAASLYTMAMTKARNFEELVKVKSKDANVSIRIKEKNNIISQIIGIVASDSTFVIFDLQGDLNVEEVGAMTSKLSESNINKVFKGNNLDLTDVKTYPNPVSAGNKVNVDLPKNMEKGKMTILSIEGKKMKEINLDGPTTEIDTNNLPKGTYSLVIENNGVSVTRKLVVVE